MSKFINHIENISTDHDRHLLIYGDNLYIIVYSNAASSYVVLTEDIGSIDATEIVIPYSNLKELIALLNKAQELIVKGEAVYKVKS